MSDISERIEDCANNGLAWLSYEPKSKYYFCINNCVTLLKASGYSVEANNKVVGKQNETLKVNTIYSLEISWN